jgi:biotin synthase
MKDVTSILKADILNKEDIMSLLQANGHEEQLIFQKAAEIKERFVQNKVYFRGLIEFSNLCRKNCLYCGIRRDNKSLLRYKLTDEEIIEAAMFAYQNHYGSVVLQSGELTGRAFINRVSRLLQKINRVSGGRLRVTLSCGEQTYETYKKWFENGAARYLLRIETSNPRLYTSIHPNDPVHSYKARLTCLENIKKAGYQLGTGVMIGLPGQTFEDMANDLLFIRQIDADMVGMGPYIEHKDTPLYDLKDTLNSRKERLRLSLRMIALLRIMMKDINIAAATALQVIDPLGREKAIMAGANVIMPNITPARYREYYLLYENKPCVGEDAENCNQCLEARISITGHQIAYDEWGDSAHYARRCNANIYNVSV